MLHVFFTGFISEVTVNGKTFASTGTWKRKVDADHSAAKSALQSLSPAPLQNGNQELQILRVMLFNMHAFGVALG